MAGQRAFIGVSADFQMVSPLPTLSPSRNATWIEILHLIMLNLLQNCQFRTPRHSFLTFAPFLYRMTIHHPPFPHHYLLSSPFLPLALPSPVLPPSSLPWGSLLRPTHPSTFKRIFLKTRQKFPWSANFSPQPRTMQTYTTRSGFFDATLF